MFKDLLPQLVFYPIIIGLVCIVIPDKLKNIARAFAFLATLASFAGNVLIFMKAKSLFWQMGAYKIFVIDNLSIFASLAVSLLAFLTCLYSIGFIEKSVGRYFGLFLITLGGALGAVYANDLIALVIFWGVLAATLFFLVNMPGSKEGASNASKKALIIIGGTDVLMIFGICLIWALTGTFAMDKMRLDLNNVVAIIAYFSIATGCFAKSGAMPFHSWLPDVAECAPTSVSAYLPASLDKLLGIYLLARLSINIFVMNNITNMILAVIGAVTIMLAVIFALIQHDLKRLLGYHAVSQVGYMVLGISTGTPIGIAGGLFHMLNNAIYKSCLFMTGGSVEKKMKTTDLAQLGGLAKYMPVTFAACLVASLAISGVPPLNGFVSKWMIYQGVIECAKGKGLLWIACLVCAMFGSALTIASFMKLLHAVFMGRASKDYGELKESGLTMTVPMVILALLCVGLGIFSFIIPIGMFIIPAIGKNITYAGIWDPGMATVLLVVGLLLGVLIYVLLKSGTFRSVKTFVGGEEPDSMERLSGVDFYETIRTLDVFKFLYKKEDTGSFDISAASGRVLKHVTRAVQYFHNGILPTYMVWCLIGMIGMFLAVMVR